MYISSLTQCLVYYTSFLNAEVNFKCTDENDHHESDKSKNKHRKLNPLRLDKVLTSVSFFSFFPGIHSLSLCRLLFMRMGNMFFSLHL